MRACQWVAVPIAKGASRSDYTYNDTSVQDAEASKVKVVICPEVAVSLYL